MHWCATEQLLGITAHFIQQQLHLKKTLEWTLKVCGTVVRSHGSHSSETKKEEEMIPSVELLFDRP